MGFIGDFFLPKHAFRFLGGAGKAALPAPGEDGKRPGPRQVMTGFFTAATTASQAIADRLFKGQPWAARCVPGSTFNLGGLAVLVLWAGVVGGLMWFAFSHLIAGLNASRLPAPKLPTIQLQKVAPAPAPSAPAPVAPKGGQDGR